MATGYFGLQVQDGQGMVQLCCTLVLRILYILQFGFVNEQNSIQIGSCGNESATSRDNNASYE